MIKLSSINYIVTEKQAKEIFNQLKIVFEDNIEYIRDLNIRIKKVRTRFGSMKRTRGSFILISGLGGIRTHGRRFRRPKSYPD